MTSSSNSRRIGRFPSEDLHDPTFKVGIVDYFCIWGQVMRKVVPEVTDQIVKPQSDMQHIVFVVAGLQQQTDRLKFGQLFPELCNVEML